MMSTGHVSPKLYGVKLFSAKSTPDGDDHDGTADGAQVPIIALYLSWRASACRAVIVVSANTAP